MTQCDQYSRNAIRTAYGVPLCLNCYERVMQIHHAEQDRLVDDMNFMSAHLNSIVGFNVSPMHPTRRPVIIPWSTTNNNIAINNSKVGVINTGTIQSLQNHVDSLRSVGVDKIEDLAWKIEDFYKSVLEDRWLADTHRKDVVESLDFIVKEMFAKDEEKKKPVVKVLLNWMESALWTTADSLTLWQALLPLLQQFFS